MVSDKITDNLKYNWAWALNPVQPLLLWADATNSLENFYKKPEINLTDSPKDLKIKNDMRHITGAALVAKTYSPLGVRPITNVKESLDLGLDYIKHTKLGISQDVLNDTYIDYTNNGIGRDFIKNNPLATKEEIINYAYNIARKTKSIPVKQDLNQLKENQSTIKQPNKIQKFYEIIKNNVKIPKLGLDISANFLKNMLNNPVQLSSADIESLTNYHKSLGEVFDKQRA